MAAPKFQRRLEIETLRSMTAEVLHNMTGVNVEAGVPFWSTGKAPECDVAGAMRVSCSAFCGSITLPFRADVLENIYEGLLGKRSKLTAADLADAAGELMNIIYGRARVELNNEHGFDLEAAQPAVLTGERIQKELESGSMVLPFAACFGDLQMFVNLQYWRRE